MIDEIRANAVHEPNTGCLIFVGPWQSRGYGIFRKCLVHRVIFEAERGEIPEGMTVDHRCKVKACINPDHLEVVTRAENTIRAHDGVRWRACHRGHDLTDPANILLAVRKDGREHRQCKACHAMHPGRTRVRKAER